MTCNRGRRPWQGNENAGVDTGSYPFYQRFLTARTMFIAENLDHRESRMRKNSPIKQKKNQCSHPLTPQVFKAMHPIKLDNLHQAFESSLVSNIFKW